MASNAIESISIGEDALSSSMDDYATPPIETFVEADDFNANTNWWKKAVRQLNILKLVPWRSSTEGTEVAEVAEPLSDDDILISQIMDCFKRNYIKGMEQFVEVGEKEHTEEDSVLFDNSFHISDEYIDDDLFSTTTMHAAIAKNKSLISRVRKTVRFEMDITPETKQERAFTPMLTSTPMNKDIDDVISDSESEDADPMPLCSQESNTVLPPSEISSILNCESIISSLNKSRQEGVASALEISKWKDGYKIYYDDTDEEEVHDYSEEEVKEVTSSINRISCTKDIPDRTYCLTPTKTFVIGPSSATNTDFQNGFMDSNISCQLNKIDEYLGRLEDEKMPEDRRYDTIVKHIARIHDKIEKLRQKYETESQHSMSPSNQTSEEEPYNEISECYSKASSESISPDSILEDADSEFSTNSSSLITIPQDVSKLSSRTGSVSILSTDISEQASDCSFMKSSKSSVFGEIPQDISEYCFNAGSASIVFEDSLWAETA